MIEHRPARQTTAALIARANQDYRQVLQRIVDMAVADGEAPVGATLQTQTTPPMWQIETPDIQPPEAPHE